MAQKLPSSETSRPRPFVRLQKGAWHSMAVPSVPEEIPIVEEAIIEVLSQAPFPDADVFAVRLALTEALANAIRHGNDSDPHKKVHVRFRIDDSAITIAVRDEGRGFDRAAVADPTEDANLELPSGRGLLLMRSYMDSVTFNDTGNEVMMVKSRGGTSCVR